MNLTRFVKREIIALVKMYIPLMKRDSASFNYLKKIAIKIPDDDKGKDIMRRIA